MLRTEVVQFPLASRVLTINQCVGEICLSPKAEELFALARLTTNPAIRVEIEKLAQNYLRLAEQAEKNSQTDIVYETPPPQQTAQQQQQIQPKKDET